MPTRLSEDERFARDTLRASGLRATPARLEVLIALRACRSPVTAQELSQRLPTPDMDRVTVYRTLGALVDVGLAHRMDPGDRIFRFAPAAPALPLSDADSLIDSTDLPSSSPLPRGHEHPHRVCDSCGTVECMEDAEVIVHRRGAPDPGSQSFNVRQQNVILHGTCGDCSTSPTPPAPNRSAGRSPKRPRKR